MSNDIAWYADKKGIGKMEITKFSYEKPELESYDFFGVVGNDATTPLPDIDVDESCANVYIVTGA